jgi:Kef-type K+ transport system membrane component KefB
MSLTQSDVAHVICASGLLLIAAHLVGYLFVRARQPRVVGEIAGGLILGPTVLGAAIPGLQHSLFPTSGVTATVLGALYQFGIIFLMFATGSTLRTLFRSTERRVAVSISGAGIVIPFAAGLAAFHLFQLGYLHGTANSSGSLSLVFATAIAVASIPVISRIMLDLGIANTPFARIVLSAAVIEDIVLYAVLAIAVGLAGGNVGSFGVARWLHIAPASLSGSCYYAGVTVVILVSALTGGRRIAKVCRSTVLSPVAYLVVLLLAVTMLCLTLSITPVFGGLAAGTMVSELEDDETEKARSAIAQVGAAFFIPLYFAIVGIQLNLVRNFNPFFFAAFLAFACIAKGYSVYVGARLAGEAPTTSRNLAVALNARGGPGIVLASVALSARIIDGRLYAYIVLLSVVTSSFAGAWLGRVLRIGAPLRTVSVVETASQSALPQSP